MANEKKLGDGTGYGVGSVPTAEGDEWTGRAKPNSDAQSPSQMGGEGPVKETGGNRQKSL